MTSIEGILQLLPHRYPFLLVDRILELEPGKKAVGLKNISINEPFFQGHFPGKPVFPGVLILEALAQLGACALLSQEKYKNSLLYLAGADKFRFRRVVVHGDQLLLEVELIKIKGNIGKARGKASVADAPAAEGEILFALEEK
ncbi:MAG TPA: 3-hydroxyacyl-ACP dehydratase FabZ [Syntrophaceticus sp.]|nr:3-hydroxyacyl-ACP dehydratase FabZ [Syntrophaceticus sp.]